MKLLTTDITVPPIFLKENATSEAFRKLKNFMGDGKQVVNKSRKNIVWHPLSESK
jgi:hypothetical protein